MNDLWLKIKVWTKAILFALLVIYAIIFALNNSHRIDLWVFFRAEYRIPLVAVILLAILVGVLGTLLVRTTIRTIRQMRELKERSRSQRLERELADMKAKAAMLHTREEPARGETPAEEPPRRSPPTSQQEQSP